jgi:glycosyltransferase involved in cell wall biosynthesis
VLEQSGDFEVVIVVDGSSDEAMQAYRQIDSEFPEIEFHYLVHQPKGHGHSYSMNHGARHSTGQYLCFLDDDDCWTDPQYLARTQQSLQAGTQRIDLHYSNQTAVHADLTPNRETLWLADLIPLINDHTEHANDSYLVDADFIMSSGGFGHLNCSIFARDFYLEIGGMDETIRYEDDHDLFIRAVDRADAILFSTRFVSQHYMPDAGKRENMSTVDSTVEKKLSQLRVYDKGICHSTRESVIRHCRRAKTYELKHIAQILDAEGNIRPALHYAGEALTNGFNLRWLAYFIYLSGKAVFAR